MPKPNYKEQMREKMMTQLKKSKKSKPKEKC